MLLAVYLTTSRAFCHNARFTAVIDFEADFLLHDEGEEILVMFG
jgi:hypothetical protein